MFTCTGVRSLAAYTSARYTCGTKTAFSAVFLKVKPRDSKQVEKSKLKKIH